MSKVRRLIDTHTIKLSIYIILALWLARGSCGPSTSRLYSRHLVWLWDYVSIQLWTPARAFELSLASSAALIAFAINLVKAWNDSAFIVELPSLYWSRGTETIRRENFIWARVFSTRWSQAIFSSLMHSKVEHLRTFFGETYYDGVINFGIAPFRMYPWLMESIFAAPA